jgi:hypothetical protein
MQKKPNRINKTLSVNGFKLNPGQEEFIKCLEKKEQRSRSFESEIYVIAVLDIKEEAIINHVLNFGKETFKFKSYAG